MIVIPTHTKLSNTHLPRYFCSHRLEVCNFRLNRCLRNTIRPWGSACHWDLQHYVDGQSFLDRAMASAPQNPATSTRSNADRIWIVLASKPNGYSEFKLPERVLSASIIRSVLTPDRLECPLKQSQRHRRSKDCNEPRKHTYTYVRTSSSRSRGTHICYLNSLRTVQPAW